MKGELFMSNAIPENSRQFPREEKIVKKHVIRNEKEVSVYA